MSKFSTRLIMRPATPLPPTTTQRLSVFEPQLASQIKNAFRFKVKGTVSHVSKGTSVFLLRMINNI